VIFAYDLNDQLIGEYTSTGAAIREYAWLGNIPIAIFTPDPAAATNPPLVYYIQTDHLNTPRVVFNKANQIRWRWLAEPFGTTAPETNPSSLGNFTQPLRFPGQYADSESGLFYNHWRYFDPSTGRYTQSDPIGLAGGSFSTYDYVNGQPTKYTDPNGLQAIIPGPGGIPMPLPVAGAQTGSSASDLARQLDRLFCSPEPDCWELQQKMEEVASELRQRYVSMTADAGNLFCERPIGRFSWLGHQMKFNDKQRQLQKLIEQAQAKGCSVNGEYIKLASMFAPSCPAR
jgi:RHS repeat-associated protein